MTTTDDAGKVHGKPRGCLGCLGRGALGLVIILVMAMAAGAIYQAAATSADAKEYPPPGVIYRVGSLDMHLNCVGEGSPTVILEAGAGSPSSGWVWVQEKVAGFTRVCSYDRPGFGWSSPASGPLSSAQVATTLHELLQAAAIPGPYVLVGHSDGGVYVRSYQGQFPSEVVGMVLVDSSHESQNLRFPPAYLASLRQQESMMKACQAVSPFGVVRLARLWTQLLPKSILTTDEGAAVLSTMYRNSYCRASANELKAVSEFLSQEQGPASLGDLPLVVISAGLSLDQLLAQTPKAAVALMGKETFAQIVQISHDLQGELVNLSTQGRQIIAEKSTHNIQWDQPELVADAIRQVVEQARRLGQPGASGTGPEEEERRGASPGRCPSRVATLRLPIRGLAAAWRAGPASPVRSGRPSGHGPSEAPDAWWVGDCPCGIIDKDSRNSGHRTSTPG